MSSWKRNWKMHLLPLVVLGLASAGPSKAPDKSGTILDFTSPDGASARVEVAQNPSSLTVTFLRQNFQLPDSLEFSYVDEGGIRRSVQLGTVSSRVVERPSYQGQLKANQDSFVGMELRIPFTKGSKVLTPEGQ